MVRKIVSKVIVIVFIIFIINSIVNMSVFAYIKGCIPIQNTIINNENVIYELDYGNIKIIPTNTVFLFYISLGLIIISSFTCLRRKVVDFIFISIALICAIYGLLGYNYIIFLLILNMYIFLLILFDSLNKNRINIIISSLSILIFCLNIIITIKHLRINFDPIKIQEFSNNLIQISNKTLIIFILWITPYSLSIIRDLIQIKYISNTR